MNFQELNSDKFKYRQTLSVLKDAANSLSILIEPAPGTISDIKNAVEVFEKLIEKYSALIEYVNDHNQQAYRDAIIKMIKES